MTDLIPGSLIEVQDYRSSFNLTNHYNNNCKELEDFVLVNNEIYYRGSEIVPANLKAYNQTPLRCLEGDEVTRVLK